MADANRCPNCGAEQPANAPEGLCPRCKRVANSLMWCLRPRGIRLEISEQTEPELAGMIGA